MKGGAYGAGFSDDAVGVEPLYSTAIRASTETVERFRTAGDWLAGVFSPTESEMDGYVVSTVASLDAPAKARESAPPGRPVLRSHLGGPGPGARGGARGPHTDVRASPRRWTPSPARDACAFGNGEVIRASGEDFNVVDLLA